MFTFQLCTLNDRWQLEKFRSDILNVCEFLNSAYQIYYFQSNFENKKLFKD